MTTGGNGRTKDRREGTVSDGRISCAGEQFEIGENRSPKDGDYYYARGVVHTRRGRVLVSVVKMSRRERLQRIDKSTPMAFAKISPFEMKLKLRQAGRAEYEVVEQMRTYFIVHEAVTLAIQKKPFWDWAELKAAMQRVNSAHRNAKDLPENVFVIDWCLAFWEDIARRDEKLSIL